MALNCTLKSGKIFMYSLPGTHTQNHPPLLLQNYCTFQRKNKGVLFVVQMELSPVNDISTCFYQSHLITSAL